jgi:hypothetical protein
MRIIGNGYVCASNQWKAPIESVEDQFWKSGGGNAELALCYT